MVLAFFYAQVPVWHADTFDSFIELLHLVIDVEENSLPYNRKGQLSLLLVWYELMWLNSWVFEDSPAWLDVGPPKLCCHYLSDLVTSFLQRVETQLFPIETELVDPHDPDSLLWALRQVHVVPMGFSLDSETDISYYAEPIQTVMTLIAFERGIVATLFHGEETPYAMTQAKFPISDLAPVIKQMTALPAIIREGLSTLIASIEGETGNIWLDVSYEDIQVGNLSIEPWSRHVVEIYTTEWQTAEPLHNRILTLIEWVRENPDTRMTQIWQTLIAARVMASRHSLH